MSNPKGIGRYGFELLLVAAPLAFPQLLNSLSQPLFVLGLVFIFFEIISRIPTSSKKRKIFTIIILTILGIFVGKFGIYYINEKMLPIEKKALKSELTLKSLFDEEFPTLLKSHSQWRLSTHNQEQLEVYSTVYSDSAAQTKFLGIYIPFSSKTFEMCQAMLAHYEQVLENDKNLIYESKMPGERPINKSELKFSGRIYIYHEQPLFYDQQIDLIRLYKNHDLGLVLRGSEYLWEKKKEKVR